MGMYTLFNCDVRIVNNPEVVAALKYMTELNFKEATEERQFPDHPLFKTDRFKIMMRCGSAYFKEENVCVFEHEPKTNSWHLKVCSNFKNYGNEVNLFFDWIDPYVISDGPLGSYRYEEDDIMTIVLRNSRKEIGNVLQLTD